MADSPKPLRPTLTDISGALDLSPLVSYALDAHLRVAYCNPAWSRFAADNDAIELAGTGALGMDLCGVTGPLHPFYMQAFARVDNGEAVLEFLYDGSSPQVYRQFQMRIHSLRPAGWYLITNLRVVERPHDAPVTTGLGNYVNSDGQIVTCCHCRRSRRAGDLEHWDFVSAHLERPLDRVVRGLCHVCHDYFYPEKGSPSAAL